VSRLPVCPLMGGPNYRSGRDGGMQRNACRDRFQISVTTTVDAAKADPTTSATKSR
jgi:hypothetical protein